MMQGGEVNKERFLNIQLYFGAEIYLHRNRQAGNLMGWDAFRQGYKKADMRNNTVFVRQSSFITRMLSCKVSLRWG